MKRTTFFDLKQKLDEREWSGSRRVSRRPLGIVNNGIRHTGAPLPRVRFLRDTRIATVRGEIPVQHLGTGDIVLTADDDRMALRDRRRWCCDGRTQTYVSGVPPWLFWPICVRTGAFGADRPHRDLWLGPDHAVRADGVMIPLRHLLDGHAVTQPTLERAEYWTLSFDRPEVLLAEGLAVETQEPRAEDPSGCSTDTPGGGGAGMLIRDGLLVEAVRARIARRRAD